MGSAKPGDQLRLSAGEGPQELIRLVTRLLVAQTVATAAVGLPFSRRHLSSILITLALVAALLALAALVRSGGHGAWLLAISFESAFAVFGVSSFLFARYLGGTLFGLITLGALLQPSVARAFATGGRGAGATPEALEDAAEGPFGGRAVG